MKTELEYLARDLWWTAEPDADELWRDLDPHLWRTTHHNPLLLLERADIERAPPGWGRRARSLLSRYEAYQAKNPSTLGTPLVAYFSMEFGLHECLPIYAGGLGVLAGDHLRSASDIGIHLVAVGLFWSEGYFEQLIRNGRQEAEWAHNDPAHLPMQPVTGAAGQPVEVEVPHGADRLVARAWEVRIGRVRLFLLDTDHPANPPPLRAITRRLYRGDPHMRVAQELVLGVGGARLLEAIGIEPDVFHMNEGHSAFLALELWARELSRGRDKVEAWAAVRDRCVFTTHTPVPAGHDRFHWDVVDPLLGPWRRELGLPAGAFMDLGRERPGDVDEPLCMTVLAMRASRAVNAVSELHAQVSRVMWHRLDIPILSITNGVHPTAWMAPATAALLDRHLPDWRDRFESPDWWSRVRNLPEREVLAAREARRARLVAGVRERLGAVVLDESALTIGFARRFATYKRANLLLRQPDRLVALLDRGVQIIFAGKAHPADGAGQAIVAEILRAARDPRFRGRLVFVPDYDCGVGRLMTAGSDVWLNNPRRPREASGTSGQKAALNGNLNCSVLDGWWPEGFDGFNGWAIGDEREWDSIDEQDAHDAEALYTVLEQQVMPTFADPGAWARRMLRAMETCLPVFNTHRMVREYADRMYRKPA